MTPTTPPTSPPTLADRAAAALASGLPTRLFEIARDEDLGPGGAPGDVSSWASVDEGALLVAAVRAREACTVAGLAFLPELLRVVAPDATFEPAVVDGASAGSGDTIGELLGPARAVLAAERPALNLVGRLSGIATRTAEFVARVAGAGAAGARAAVCDTRKTSVGARVLEKYAVACGGGVAHRTGLHDAALLKDNHAAARAAGVTFGAWAGEVARRARESRPDLRFVQVECDTLEQFAELLALPAGLIDMALLDNMAPAELARAVAMRDAAGSALRLEASGGVTLDSIAAIARTGVDRISVGSITHGARSVDVGLDAVARGEEAPEPPRTSWADELEPWVAAHGAPAQRVVVLESTESTQDAARAMSAGRPGLVVLAGRQTAGRGRLGRVWHDPRGQGLAMSITLDASLHPGRLALAAGLALVDAGNALCGAERFALRWPNDAVHRATGRKLAGVLIELGPGAAVVGFGMNVAQRAPDWLERVREQAISLRQVACGATRVEAARAVLGALQRWLGATDCELAAHANRHNALEGVEREFTTAVGRRQVIVRGAVRGIEPDGSLVLESASGGIERLDGATTSLAPGNSAASRSVAISAMMPEATSGRASGYNPPGLRTEGLA